MPIRVTVPPTIAAKLTGIRKRDGRAAGAPAPGHHRRGWPWPRSGVLLRNAEADAVGTERPARAPPRSPGSRVRRAARRQARRSAPRARACARRPPRRRRARRRSAGAEFEKPEKASSASMTPATSSTTAPPRMVRAGETRSEISTPSTTTITHEGDDGVERTTPRHHARTARAGRRGTRRPRGARLYRRGAGRPSDRLLRGESSSPGVGHCSAMTSWWSAPASPGCGRPSPRTRRAWTSPW